MVKRYMPARQTLALNLTALLDVIFQLIVFFLLVTNFTAAELPQLEPPSPQDSQARDRDRRQRVVVNLLPREGTGQMQMVRVGLRDIAAGDYGQLTALLERERERSEVLEVDLRADRSIHYREVFPVMQAITSAGVERINVVAHLDREH